MDSFCFDVIVICDSTFAFFFRIGCYLGLFPFETRACSHI